MKKIFILIMLMLVTVNIAFGFNYSDEDKNMFYDAFIDGYIEQMTNKINALDIEQQKKESIITEFKKLINKTELINSSWNCIQKYPINDIVSASINCTAEWTANQSEKNKKLLQSIK